MIPSETKEEKERERESSGERCNDTQKQGGGTDALKESNASPCSVIKMFTKSCLKSGCSLEAADYM